MFARKKTQVPRIIVSTELRDTQNEIEKMMNSSQVMKRQQDIPPERGKVYMQSHVRDFFHKNNNNGSGHRIMARSPHVGVTRKINILNLI